MKEYVPDHFPFLVDWTIKLYSNALDQSKGIHVRFNFFSFLIKHLYLINVQLGENQRTNTVHTHI